MRNQGKRLTIVVFLCVIFLMGNAWAQDIKARMLSRLPVIVDLKARGVVGENNQGYLETLKGQTEKQDVVAAENQDRRTVYEQIAKQNGTDLKMVGQRRAAQIAEKASAGEWLQDAAGKWYKK